MQKEKQAQPGTAPEQHRITTGCKVNLYLKVLERLENGYHTIESLFLPLHAPSDILTITHLPATHKADALPQVECSMPGVEPTNNTVTKAWQLYTAATGFAPVLHIFIEKNVPMGAGLGGGSANAAGFLLYLQRMAAAAGVPPLSGGALTALAAKVGADVPFFLQPSPAMATGIGEKLVPVENPFKSLWLLLVCPAIAVNTAWAYTQLDEKRKKSCQKKEKCLTYSAVLDTSSFADGVTPQNDFEEVVFQQYPVLYQIKQELLKAGATSSLMSGTGSSVFGLFTTQEEAQEASHSATIRNHVTYLQNV